MSLASACSVFALESRTSALERFLYLYVDAVMVVLPPGGAMAPYSIDLRERVARAWDAGLNADRIAAKYEVSRAWVYRLLQRRRETGSLAPRAQTKFRRRTLTPAQEDRLVALITARPDATLVELQRRAAHGGGAEHDLARDWPPGPDG